MNNNIVYQSIPILAEIVRTSQNIHQALLALGKAPKGANYKIFKEECKALGISIAHFKDDKQRRQELSQEEITNSVINSISRMQALNTLLLRPDTNANVNWIDNRIKLWSLDISHWKGQGHLKGRTNPWVKSIPLENILIKNSTYHHTCTLKKRLVDAQLLQYRCYRNGCSITEWYGQKLSLHLEHINGDSSDNRIENLILLCPNCHSQTPTYCRAKSSLEETKSTPKYTNTCQCGRAINERSATCKSCVKKSTKIVWPSIDELALMVADIGYSATGRKLGVSDKAVHKHLKRAMSR